MDTATDEALVRFRLFPSQSENPAIPDGARSVDPSGTTGARLLEMRVDAFSAWYASMAADPSALAHAGIDRVEEILQDPYDYESIRRLLVTGFDARALDSFVDRWFAGARPLLARQSAAAAKADALVDFCREHGRIHHILTHGREEAPKAYSSAGPFHRKARILPPPVTEKSVRPARIREPLFTLAPRDVILASASAILVATAGTLVYRVLMALPWPGAAADFTYFFGVIIALMGAPVGEVARRAARGRHGLMLAILTAACFLLGYGLGGSVATYVQMLVYGVPGFGFGAALGIGFLGIFGLIVPPGTLTLAAAFGIYLAWRRTR